MENENFKILIVDDEPDIIQFIKYNLKKEGFQVVSAGNGAEGVAKAKSERPDLILMDIMMPEMDGVEACRILRMDREFDNTVIAFLTARNEDYSQIAALDVGGDDYINKPIRPRVLVSRIKALLRRGQRTDKAVLNNSNIIFIRDLKIDKEKIQVVRNGEVIDLAKKEFELLYLLGSKPGKVFTREEIFLKVWGPEIIVGNRTIDVHIRKLREKLGDHYIKTLKGIGYKMEENE